jgi:NRAMP (natural resistance-associated macrophage protein)-like metal ion transporter
MQVVGSAIAISLLTYGAIPLWAGVIVTAVASFLLLLLERLGVRWLEALFAVLIGVMGLSFGIMYVLAGVPTVQVLEGKLPLILPAWTDPRQSNCRAEGAVCGADWRHGAVLWQYVYLGRKPHCAGSGR